MKLVLPTSIVDRWVLELRRGRKFEIGGILIAEYVEAETFRLVEFSRQQEAGTYVRFVRDDVQAREFVSNYLAHSQRDPRQCNYIGEWHSHPQFSVSPSREDATSMFELARDPHVGIGFAVLIIVRLSFLSTIQMSCTSFAADGTASLVDVIVDGKPANDGWLTKLKKFIGL